MRYLALMTLLGMLIMAMPQAHADNNALEQLQQMAGGQEHTGVKFDGSPNSQRRSGIDTTVNYQVNTSSTPTGVDRSSYTVQNSSSSYNVQNSSQTTTTPSK